MNYIINENQSNWGWWGWWEARGGRRYFLTAEVEKRPHKGKRWCLRSSLRDTPQGPPGFWLHKMRSFYRWSEHGMLENRILAEGSGWTWGAWGLKQSRWDGRDWFSQTTLNCERHFLQKLKCTCKFLTFLPSYKSWKSSPSYQDFHKWYLSKCCFSCLYGFCLHLTCQCLLPSNLYSPCKPRKAFHVLGHSTTCSRLA